MKGYWRKMNLMSSNHTGKWLLLFFFFPRSRAPKPYELLRRKLLLIIVSAYIRRVKPEWVPKKVHAHPSGQMHMHGGILLKLQFAGKFSSKTPLKVGYIRF